MPEAGMTNERYESQLNGMDRRYDDAKDKELRGLDLRELHKMNKMGRMDERGSDSELPATNKED